jgi:hypothetical protein
LAKTNVTAVIEQLSRNPRLMRLFQRKPESALARFHLSENELAAVKEGTLPGLLAVGMDPRIAMQKPASKQLLASLIFQHGAKLAPAAFLALTMALWPHATASASPPEGKRARAVRVISGLRQRTLGRRIAIRRLERAGARRARARLGVLIRRSDIGLKRALRRVGGDLDDDNGGVD